MTATMSFSGDTAIDLVLIAYRRGVPNFQPRLTEKKMRLLSL
jgi:hypothetical protein